MVPSPGEHPVPGITGSPRLMGQELGSATGWAAWAVPRLALCPPWAGSKPSTGHGDGQARDSSGWELTPILRAAGQKHVPGDWGREGWSGPPCLLLPPATLEGIVGWREKRREN